MKLLGYTFRAASLALVGVVAFVAATVITVPSPAAAQSTEQALCEGAGGTFSGGKCSGGTNKTVEGTFRTVANVLIFIVGAVSVLMIIIGGLRYTLSAGDQSAITAAKNTVLFAVIGVVIAVVSFAIVNFILTRFGIK